jgi:NAD+ kinase
MIKNIQIISDKNDKSKKIKFKLLKLIEKAKYKDSNIVIVVGGDGFMLQNTLKKIKSQRKFFFMVMNSGNFGFLMNKYSPKNFIKNLLSSKMISISPFEMTVESK